MMGPAHKFFDEKFSLVGWAPVPVGTPPECGEKGRGWVGGQYMRSISALNKPSGELRRYSSELEFCAFDNLE